VCTALRETERPSAGGETILSKLSELLFLQAVRDYLNGLPAEWTGWLFRLARPSRRHGDADPDSCSARPPLDIGCAGARGRIVPLYVRRTFCDADWGASDAVSQQLASPGRDTVP